MKISGSQTIKLSLTLLAMAMMFCATLPCGSARATSDRKREGADSPGNPDFILFRRGALDTRAKRESDSSAADSLHISALREPGRRQLRVVQFAGPIKRRWIEQLKATGSEIIGYIPNNAYIIRSNAGGLARIAALDAGESADDSRPIRWMGRFEPLQKIAPEFDDRAVGLKEKGQAAVEIELLDTPDNSAAIEYINRIATTVNQPPRRFLKFVVVCVTLPIERLASVADFDEVLFINPDPALSLQDERSLQIVAGNLIPDRTQPTGPGYMGWLEAQGLNWEPDFLIDFADSGLDHGFTSKGLVHPGFLDAEGESRVAYNVNYTRSEQSEDITGHGTMTASIACGRGISDRTDEEGYMYGVGIEPNARLGESRIFDDFGALSLKVSYSEMISAAYSRGARISNNSWGNGSNIYNSLAQEYDARTRDAQSTIAGNQEMIFVFSAGNQGPGGHVSSPGTAKNVITVAASENFRPEGVDSCDLDGQGPIGPEGADNSLDILRFSSGGPTADNRFKPDITAPGTHVFGAASQATFFYGNGLCPGRTLFNPSGQRLYTWSSGTSLAAPHVTGAAALARKFFVMRDLLGDNRAPSPAMTKAFLVNSASYLTGENAGGDLPSARQGWGLLDMARAFDDGSRRLIDQTTVFTESGQHFEIKGAIADRSRPLRVTLAWTDAPGSLAGPALVNDLDLEITVDGQTVYRGNNFQGEFSVATGEADRLNNVESIYLPAASIPEGSSGNFTITVRAANIAGDGVPGNGDDLDQDFALVAYNVTDPIVTPPKKVPTVTLASYVKKVLTITGENFSADASVEVNGEIVNRAFTFDAATNSLSIKKKYKKLNLKKNDTNQIVIIEKGERSQAFSLQL